MKLVEIDPCLAQEIEHAHITCNEATLMELEHEARMISTEWRTVPCHETLDEDFWDRSYLMALVA